MENNQKVNLDELISEYEKDLPVTKTSTPIVKTNPRFWHTIIFTSIIVPVISIILAFTYREFAFYFIAGGFVSTLVFLITFTSLQNKIPKRPNEPNVYMVHNPEATRMAAQIARHYNMKPVGILGANIVKEFDNFISIEQSKLNELNAEETKCLLVQKLIHKKYYTVINWISAAIPIVICVTFFINMIKPSSITSNAHGLLAIPLMLCSIFGKKYIDYLSIYESLKYVRSYSVAYETILKSTVGFSPTSIKSNDPVITKEIHNLLKRKLGYLNKAAKKLDIPIPINYSN